ncbi:MAG TPA: MFS transporter [Blastocatellia bacterium]|jgi:predicted MFS family arabinose efflux permease|nr:MFS transporter [Blastocatellia bacterium]
MNQRRLFIASCLSLVVTAMIFALRGNVEDLVLADPAVKGFFNPADLRADYGWLSTMAFFGFAASILVTSPMLDALGMRNLLYLAFALHVVGILGFIVAPSYTMMSLTMLLAGFGNGLVEAVINPLIATMYPEEKTHKLNVLHSWWPGGLIIGGLLGYLMKQADVSWQMQMGVILIPTIVYGAMIFGQQFPLTERKASGISTNEMLKTALNPAFLLLIGCMMITASIELAPGQMVSSVLEKTAGMDGILILVYGSALMFVLRYFAGPIAHKISPIGMMWASVTLAAAGLFLLASASTPALAYVAATVFYVGVCFMWPTMLGITSERFPQGGAFTMGLMGFAGQFALGVVIFNMGKVRDRVGDAASFKYVAALAVAPFVVYALWWFKDKAAGGYKAVKLSQSS